VPQEGLSMECARFRYVAGRCHERDPEGNERFDGHITFKAIAAT
jgi:hypothetical protein